MLRKQHAGCGVASDGTAESMTATCRARAVHERMPVGKSVQLKAGGRGGGPPCGALEQIVVHEYRESAPSKSLFGFETKKSAPSRSLFVTEIWAKFFFAPGGRVNAFPTLPHAPQCIPDVRNHYLKITPNLRPASCSIEPGASVTILGVEVTQGSSSEVCSPALNRAAPN